VRVLGVEQASRHGAERYEEGEDHRALTYEFVHFLTPAALAEWGKDDCKQEHYDDIGGDGAERKDVCD